MFTTNLRQHAEPHRQQNSSKCSTQLKEYDCNAGAQFRSKRCIRLFAVLECVAVSVAIEDRSFCGKICTALGKLLRKLNQVSLLALSSRTSILALNVVSLVCLEIFFIVRWLWGDRGGLFLVDGNRRQPHGWW